MTPSKSPEETKVRRGPLLASLIPAAIAAGLLAVTTLAGVPGESEAAPAQGSAGSSAHTDGQWQETPVPVKKGDLTAVAALDDKQAWAVGYRLKSDKEAEAVALRWDGTSWNQESALPDGSFPQALSVRSAEDIWVAGTDTQHWDGKKWTTHKLAEDPGGRVVPDAVSSTADGKTWAVGRAVPRSIKDGVPAIQVWDDGSWKRQPLPGVGRGELTGVAALAPDDVWAVGTAFAAGEGKQQAGLVLHWDGEDWKRVDSPAVAGSHAWLSGITALSADDVWAVGGSTSGGSDRPHAIHWDGKEWAAAETPDIADGRLRAVGRDGNGKLWAVGGKGAVSVALRWNSTRERWERAADPGVVVRSFGTVPGSAELWTAGISKRGDLVPAITRLRG